MGTELGEERWTALLFVSYCSKPAYGNLTYVWAPLLEREITVSVGFFLLLSLFFPLAVHIEETP